MKLNKVNLHQALRGKGLKSVERDVLQAMASYGGYDLTKIKPALETVAKDYGFNIKTVRDTVHSLKAKGILLEVKKGGGRNTPTEYKVETLPTDGSVSTDQQAGNPTVSVLETLPSDDGNPTVSVAKPYRPVGDNQSLTSSSPVKRDQSGAGAPHGSAGATPMDDDFNAWSMRYPKQVDQSRTKTAYMTARTKVSAEVLMSSVKRFAASMIEQNRPPKFITLPWNWLDKEMWKDYPEPPESAADVEAWIRMRVNQDLDIDLTYNEQQAIQRFVGLNIGLISKEDMLQRIAAKLAPAGASLKGQRR